MRVDVQLDDSELALLAGYNRSTTMGIKKPGELQRELLSDMENIEEKRMSAIPEESKSATVEVTEGKAAEGKVASAAEEKNRGADEGQAEEANSAPVRVRSDFLSMLSAMAQPNTHEDKDSEDSEDSEAEDEDAGILPEDEDEEDTSVLPEDEDEEDESVLPADEDEENESVLPADDEGVSTLPDDDDEYDEDDGILPADDEGAEGESTASEEPTAGIIEQQEDGYSSELPADDDEEYSSELLEDEDTEEDSSVLPDDDEADYSVLPDDEDEGSSVLPDDEDEEGYSVLPDDEDSEEVEDEAPSAGIPETRQERTIHYVEKPVSPSHKVHKSKKPEVHHSAPRPSGYSAPSVSLYDFILNNGGSMLIEDVRKYYPIDEVKKALSLGKIYRFGNHVGV